MRNAGRPRTIFRLGWLAGPVAVAACSAFIHLLRGREAPVPNLPILLVPAVIWAAFLGGRWSTLASSALAVGYIAVYFSAPGGLFEYTPEARNRVLLWGAVLPVSGFMVGLLKSQLVAANAALERAAHARAQRASEALQENERRFRSMADNFPGAMYRAIVSPDGGFRLVYMSEGARRTLGFAPDEVVRNPEAALGRMAPSDRARILETTRLMGQGLAQADQEFQVTDSAGATRWVRRIATAHRLPSGEVAVDGVAIDITAQKEAEAALRESENRFRFMADAAPAMIYITAASGQVTYFNRGWVEYTGRPMEQDLGAGWAEVVHPEDRERCVEEYELATRRRVEFRHEYRLRRRDGVYRWVLDIGTPTFDAGGEFAGYVGACIDITDRRIAEERYRLLFETSRDAIIIADDAGRFVQANRAAADLFGVALSTLESMSVVNLAVPPGHPSAAEQFEAYRREGGSTGEFTFVRPDGRVRIAEFTARRFTEELHVLVLRDVTERKAAEDALRESEARFRQFAETIEDVVWITGLGPDEVQFVNSAFESVWGIPAERLMENGRLWHESIHPEDRARAEAAFTQWQRGSSVERVEIEYRIVRPDGGVRWILDRGSVVRDEHGKVFRLAGVASDVTRRKAAERKVKESEHRYRGLVEESPDTVMVHQDWRLVFINRAGAEMFGGASPKEMIGMDVLRLAHPEVHEIVRARIRALYERNERTPTRVQRLLRLDGTEFYAEVSASPCSFEGRPAAQVVMRDLSERMRTEERLRLLNRELEHRVKNNLAAIQVIADQTARHSPDLGSFRASFQNRIAAMSRVNRLLANSADRPIPVDELLRLALDAYADAGAMSLDGPRGVLLVSDAAEVLHRVVNELAANAVKHGALSTPEGRVAVSWSKEPGTIRLEWRESGGPAVSPPAARGFGAELIEGSIPHEVGGRVAWAFDPAGLRCTIEIPDAAAGVSTPVQTAARGDAASTTQDRA